MERMRIWYPCPVRTGPSRRGSHHADRLGSEAHRTPQPATARDRTADDRPRDCPPTQPRLPRPLPRRSAPPRHDDGDRVRRHLARAARRPPLDPRLGRERVQLGVRIAAGQPDEQGPRHSRPARPQGRLEADRDRPVAQQGHDRPRLLQPHDPRARATTSSTSSTRRATATGSPARTSAGTTTRTTSRPRRSSASSWLRPATGRTSSARPGTSSGSAPTRARPARRCGP